MLPSPYTPDHYQTLCQWWQSHGWDPPPAIFLPATAFIIPRHAAAFLYHDPTASLAGIEWIVTNPANTPKQSMQAITTLMAHIAAHAKTLGILALFTSCRQASLGRLIVKSGFVPSDQSVNHYILPL